MTTISSLQSLYAPKKTKSRHVPTLVYARTHIVASPYQIQSLPVLLFRQQCEQSDSCNSTSHYYYIMSFLLFMSLSRCQYFSSFDLKHHEASAIRSHSKSWSWIRNITVGKIVESDCSPWRDVLFPFVKYVSQSWPHSLTLTLKRPSFSPRAGSSRRI